MTEKLLYLHSTNADLGSGEFSKYLRPAAGSATNLSIALVKNAEVYGYGYSYAEEIDLRAGTGTITVNVRVSTANANADCRVRAHRVSDNGTILASTAWTATQALGSTITYTFVTESVDWTDAAETDRLMIEYGFFTDAHSAALAIQTGSNSSIVTPFTNELDIDVASGEGSTSPSPGTYEYVVAGREVGLTATPEDLTWVFDKWVINNQDVFENPTMVTMTEDIVARAHFAQAAQYNVTVSIEAGQGTVNPTEGVHTYYEGETVTIETTPTNEEDNVIFVIDGVTYRDTDGNTTIGFQMPSHDIDVEVYFKAPSVILERKDGEEGVWTWIAEVHEPDNDFVDTDNLQDDVEYFYRGKRFESNYESDWSEEVSIVYEGVEEPPGGVRTVSSYVASVTSQATRSARVLRSTNSYVTAIYSQVAAVASRRAEETVTSHIRPLSGASSRTGKGTRDPPSHISSIYSNALAHMTTAREVSSWILPITTTVDTFIARAETRTVSSFIKSLIGTVVAAFIGSRSVTTHLRDIRGSIAVYQVGTRTSSSYVQPVATSVSAAGVKARQEILSTYIRSIIARSVTSVFGKRTVAGHVTQVESNIETQIYGARTVTANVKPIESSVTTTAAQTRVETVTAYIEAIRTALVKSTKSTQQVASLVKPIVSRISTNRQGSRLSHSFIDSLSGSVRKIGFSIKEVSSSVRALHTSVKSNITCVRIVESWTKAIASGVTSFRIGKRLPKGFVSRITGSVATSTGRKRTMAVASWTSPIISSVERAVKCQRTTTSSVHLIDSSVDRTGKGTRTSIGVVEILNTQVERHGLGTRDTNSYIDSLQSNVEASRTRLVRASTYVGQLYTRALLEAGTIRQLRSYVRAINAEGFRGGLGDRDLRSWTGKLATQATRLKVITLQAENITSTSAKLKGRLLL